ncbi:amino acid adenylation domain-containing protein [Kitasatospora sp. GAS1066B]|uniref:non-ribosomal peptide synthetase n=1 Tax=Kitasatospora sp. GAS1066B TaxID=3156271 RepID=UPI00351872B1
MNEIPDPNSSVTSVQSRLLSRIRRRATADRIARRDISGPLPLSFAQQRLWFLDQLEPGGAEYLMPCALRITGTLDLDALEAALSGLVTRHEVLRTRFVADDTGQPAQLVEAPWPVSVTVHDLRTDGELTDRQAAARELLRNAASLPFELAAGRPLRADLVRMAQDEQYLLLTVHHIASDGWSQGILARELRALYAAALTGQAAELPEPAVQYADFALWQRQWLTGTTLERQLGYWRAQLAGIEPLELPTDHRRPARHGGSGDTVLFSVPAEVTERLKSAAASEGASLFMVLLGVFQLLLSKYSGQQDIAVGTPIAGRNRAEIEDVIGFFVNTLVLRTDLSGDPTFGELLARVKEAALGAYDHQDLPFERLVEELAPERDLSRNPLFQTMLVLQAPESSGESADGGWGLAGTRVEPVELKRGFAKFDLTLNLVESGDGLLAALEYRTDLFEPATMERLVGHFQTLLAGVAARPEARLSELEMLTAAERQQIVVDWNATGGDYPDTATIHSLIEERCERDPDAIALTYGESVLTYRQVNERANQLAHHLRDQGVTPDTLIAVCLDRSPDLICALLGILKAGAAFVPLDPDYPTDRITYMIEDTATPLVITHSTHAERLPSGTPLLLVDQDWPTAAATSNPAPIATPDHLAYLIYTSGSTGRPKGVQLDHRGVVNYLHWCDLNYPTQTDNGIGTLLYSSVTFDLTITALFLPLIQGQQLAIPVPAADQSAFDAAIDLILTGTEISFLKATPSHLELLTTHLEHSGKHHNIATIVAGGEDLSPTLANRILTTGTGHTVIANEYGATEGSVANVMSLNTTIDPTAGTTPVGTAITNTTAYIVDRHNHPVPIGIPGECLLGGICVARGYHNRPELTTTRFVDLDLNGATERVYRTGDLVRWREDGHMEFIGRIDNQVKLRGYRIELGEIENNLLTHPTITATTVVLRQDTPSDKRLVAYLVSTNTPTTTELRTHLQHHLPDYMIPTTYITLPHLPLTPNGKIDQKALPTPDHHRPDLDATYTPPRTPVEEAIAGAWSAVLGIERVGIHDNFFELGGQSINAVRIASRISEAGWRVSLQQIMRHTTIAELAAALTEPSPSGTAATAAPAGLIVHLSDAQAVGLPRLFCVHPGGGSTHSYRQLAARLAGAFDVYGVQAAGLNPGEAPIIGIEAMAARYWAEIRSVQPEGPCLLLGWSTGAVVAHELCVQRPDDVMAAFLLEPAVTGPEQRARFERYTEVYQQVNALWQHGQRQTGADRAATERALKQLAPQMNIEVDAVTLDEWLPYEVLEAEVRSLAAYQPGRAFTRGTLFVSESVRTAGPEDSADEVGPAEYTAHWQRCYPAGLEILDLPGRHLQMVKGAEQLEALASALDKLERNI